MSPTASGSRRACPGSTEIAERRTCCGPSSWPASSRAIRESCRAASSSASPWREPSSSSPKFSCSTSLSAISMQTYAKKCDSRFDVSHESFGITTLYVTHDQAEAMVISDRVAVLHRGRIVQAGTAEDLFRRPRTRFVAEFIGRTNLVDVVAAEPGVVTRGALRLRLAATGLTPGAPVVVSIRPHEIELLAAGRAASPERNILRATVERVSYLGDTVDYLMRVSDGDLALRVTAPPPARFKPGEPVTLALAPEACVPLTEPA